MRWSWLAAAVVGALSWWWMWSALPRASAPPGERVTRRAVQAPPPAVEAPRLARLLFQERPPARRGPVRSRVWGTLVCRREEESLAAISAEPAARAHLYGVGDELDGERIARITRNQVWVRRGGRLVALDGDAPPAAAAASTPVPGLPVTDLGGRRLAVDRAALERDLPQVLQALGTTTHLFPVFDGRRPLGFRVAMPASSPLAALGLKSGDVLTAVGGQPLTPAAALDLAARWRTLGAVDVEVLRGAERLTFHLEPR